MVKKPGSRRTPSRRNRYLAVTTILLVVLVATGAYILYPKGSDCALIPDPHATYARVDTSQGCFEVQLLPGSAPLTVANFVKLLNSGFYDGLVWHRIATSPPVIQTGDPLTRDGGGDRTTWGRGGSSQTVPLEVGNSSLHNDRGYLGMARGSDNNSGTSQFYVNLQDNRYLDGRYTVFGKVISGMNVVDTISSLPLSTQYSDQPDDPSQAMLLGVTILSSTS